MVLETAVNGRAGALETHNARSFADADTFDIDVIPPSRFLERMQG